MSQPKLWMPESVYGAMLLEAEKWKPLETGGTFMGYRNNEDIVITDLIDGGPKAERTRNSFNPDQDYQLQKIEEIYLNSGGNLQYLGDWHTHPNGTVKPSMRDKITLIDIAKCPESQNPHPIMIILGNCSGGWTLGTLQFQSGFVCLRRIPVCRYLRISHKLYPTPLGFVDP